MNAMTTRIPDAPGGSRAGALPWYRQFWPWFLVVLPAASVALSFFTLYMALEGGDAVVPHEGDSTSYSAPRAPGRK